MAATIRTSDRWLRLTTRDGDVAREAILQLERAGIDADAIAVSAESLEERTDQLDRRNLARVRNRFGSSGLIAATLTALIVVGVAWSAGATGGELVGAAIASVLVGFVVGGFVGMVWELPASTEAFDTAASADRWTILAEAPDSRIAEVAGAIEHLADGHPRAA